MHAYCARFVPLTFSGACVSTGIAGCFGASCGFGVGAVVAVVVVGVTDVALIVGDVTVGVGVDVEG